MEDKSDEKDFQTLRIDAESCGWIDSRKS